MKKLVKYSEGCAKHIYRILEKPSAQYTAETFHELRVEIKKLRFLHDLGKFSIKKIKAIKFSNAFDVIFKGAGEVRDAQIEMASLDAFTKQKLFIGFHLLIKDKLQIAKRKFSNEIKQIDKRFIKKTFKGIHTLSKSISRGDVEEYIKSQIKIIKKLAKNRNLEKVLHDIRKHLKKIGYAEKVIHEKKKKNMHDSLSHLLGRWHDNQVVLNQIRKMLKTETKNEKEAVLLRKIMIELSKKDANYFHKIRSKVNQLI